MDFCHLHKTFYTTDNSVELNWNGNGETDLLHYAIYKGAIQNFTPSQYNLLATSATNSYTDEAIVDYRVYYKVSAVDISGNESGFSDEASILVGVKDKKIILTKFLLEQNYPNPFNPSTTIKYSIPFVVNEYFSFSNTTLKVFDILGREVATLVNKQQNAGNYEVIFNASNLSSGVYFYRLQSGNFVETKKLILLR